MSQGLGFKRSAALCSALLIAACGLQTPQAKTEPEVLRVPAGTAHFTPLGAALPVTQKVAAFSIMSRHVSQAEYAQCVEDGECAELDEVAPSPSSDSLPVVGVSWHDAAAYAQWLSKQSGVQYRLPSQSEWILAAAETFVEGSPIVDDPDNPAQRWLAEYEQESSRTPLSKTLMPFASLSANQHGLLNVAGNVWEWTDSCYGAELDGFCGIRIAGGRHLSALSDFIRDPIAGACSVGVPPTHLGIRLVRVD